MHRRRLEHHNIRQRSRTLPQRKKMGQPPNETSDNPTSENRTSCRDRTASTATMANECLSVENVTRAAARGTLFTLVLRLISFVCTQLTIRALDPSTLGTSIQLELILTTILFISREGFRLALTQNVVPENQTVGSKQALADFFMNCTFLFSICITFYAFLCR